MITAHLSAALTYCRKLTFSVEIVSKKEGDGMKQVLVGLLIFFLLNASGLCAGDGRRAETVVFRGRQRNEEHGAVQYTEALANNMEAVTKELFRGQDCCKSI